MTVAELKAPFPYPGGKSRVADLVWERLGNVDNFAEPFAGSLAVLLRRPAEHFAGGYRVETVNDANHFLVNFWRAVANAPEAVAEHADWPVTEADLHARHKWLVRSEFAAGWRKRMAEDPTHFDAKIAGWWVWGQCCWIGGAWCNDGFIDRAAMPQLDAPHGGHRGARRTADVVKVPDLTSGGCGVAAPGDSGTCKVPELSSGVGRGDTAAHTDALARYENQRVSLHDGNGIHAKRPAIGDHTTGRGVDSAPGGRPQLTDAFDIGRGVNAGGNIPEHIPVLRSNGGIGDGVTRANTILPGTCDARRAWLTDWMRRLSDRLRLVRTCYGHWSRVCDSDSTLTRLGTTGVFLDPPYPAVRADTGAKSRDTNLYATDKGADLSALRDEVLAWCRKWGRDKQIRVALCCYEGDGYEPLEAEGWSVTVWEASGGYGNQRRKGKGKAANAKRERIYFSPNCAAHRQPGLFDEVTP